MCVCVCVCVFVCLECPAGFSASDSSCYRVVNDNLPWSLAALRCQALHPQAHLVAIGDEFEQNDIADIIGNHLESTMMRLCLADYFLLRPLNNNNNNNNNNNQISSL